MFLFLRREIMAVSKTLLTQVNAPLGIFNLPTATTGSQPVIKTTFDALGSVVSGLETDVGTLQTDVGTLQTDVSSLETQVTTNTSDISTIGTDVSSLNTTVGGLETTVTSLSSDVSTLQTDVTTAQSDISTLQTEVAAIKAPFKSAYAYNAPVWSTADGISTLTLTNTQHGLGTSRMSNFSIVVTQASGSLEADEDVTALGKVKRASNGNVTFEIDSSYLVSTFNTYVAVFA